MTKRRTVDAKTARPFPGHSPAGERPGSANCRKEGP